MSMLDRSTNRDHQTQSFSDTKFVTIAVLIKRHAFDQFHDEEWGSFLGRVGIKNSRDVWMFHHRNRLPLRFKPCQRIFAKVSANKLKGNIAFDGMLLGGTPDNPHAAFSDRARQPITTYLSIGCQYKRFVGLSSYHVKIARRCLHRPRVQVFGI